MNYLIGEIVLYLLATAALAWLCGWLFTRSAWKHKLEDAEVALMGHMHTIQKELDATRDQRIRLSEQLEAEKAQNHLEEADLSRIQQELQNANMRYNERKQQIQTLTRESDIANNSLKTTRNALDAQTKDNAKLKTELTEIRSQLSRFEGDLDEITEQSRVLKNAFEQARMGVLERDRRIAELESQTGESLQLAALSGNTDPELAISRIGRLQNRVQELFDEIAKKDNEISQLKASLENQKKPSIVDQFLRKKEDDLQKIRGLAEEHVSVLRRLGVTRFSDIAKWNEKDVERFDVELNSQGTIRREHWVEQAKALTNEGAHKGH